MSDHVGAHGDSHGDCAAMPAAKIEQAAFSHAPDLGFSLFLANRTKTIHFIRHAEGTHNEANEAYGDDTPCTFTTEGAWRYQDAHLTDKGIEQCAKSRDTLLQGVNPELVVVSPFTRTLQTAHVMFSGKGYPFVVYHPCRERWGKFTCDKRRSKTEIKAEMAPLYTETHDSIDFDTYGYPYEEDEDWTDEREPDETCTARGVTLLRWLATRPEKEIAVVTHSSFLKHMFKAFGWSTAEKDLKVMRRKTGNAELRSITLAMHKGFYPEGDWDGDEFRPKDASFRVGKWATKPENVAKLHHSLNHDAEREFKKAKGGSKTA